MGKIITPDSFNIGVEGIVHTEHYRNGELIGVDDTHNIVVDEGLSHTLSVVIAGGTQITAWYLGIYESNYTPLAADTAATISANAIESTAYSELTRPAFTPGAVVSNSIDNSASRAVFTINAARTMYGVFLISESTKQSTLGTLMSAALFTNARSVIAGDQLFVTYTLTAQDV